MIFHPPLLDLKGKTQVTSGREYWYSVIDATARASAAAWCPSPISTTCVAKTVRLVVPDQISVGVY